jgi:hypothetical protein
MEEGLIEEFGLVLPQGEPLIVTNGQLACFMDFLMSDQGGDVYDQLPIIAGAMRDKALKYSDNGCNRRAAVMTTLADCVDRFHSKMAVSFISLCLVQAFMSVSRDEKPLGALVDQARKGVSDFEESVGCDTLALTQAADLALPFLYALALWNVVCEDDERATHFSPELDEAVELLGWSEKWPHLSGFYDSVKSLMLPAEQPLRLEQMELALSS